jgi:hypothetical protein
MSQELQVRLSGARDPLWVEDDLEKDLTLAEERFRTDNVTFVRMRGFPIGIWRLPFVFKFKTVVGLRSEDIFTISVTEALSSCPTSTTRANMYRETINPLANTHPTSVN